jgi:hypothetical protein
VIQAIEINSLSDRHFWLEGYDKALLAGVGWIAAYILNGRRDDRTKRIQLTIDHTSTQLRDFYVPLVALTDQLEATDVVKGITIAGKTDEEEKREISQSFYYDRFLPLHCEINQILKTKAHLIEGATIPQT